MISSSPLAAGSPSKAAWTSSASVRRSSGISLQKTIHDSLGLRQRVCTILACLAVISESAGDLLDQPCMQRVDQAADVIGDIGPVQILPSAVAGIEDLPQIGQDVDDFAVARQRAVAQVVDRPAFVVGFDDPLCDRGQRLLDSKIGSHRSQPFASSRTHCCRELTLR